MPTVQEAIEFLQNNYKPTDVIAYDFFTVQDIKDHANEALSLKITDEQAEKVLEQMEHNLDSTNGLTWDSVESNIRDLGYLKR